MRILLVTIANRGAVDMGVGCYYNNVADILESQGHEVHFFNHPRPLKVDKITLKHSLVPVFAGMTSNRFGQVFETIKPDAVHIQNEVGLGVAARHYCVTHSIPYSGSYHTNWDIGMKNWAKIPASPIWLYLRWFYKSANLIHANTPRVKQLLNDKGIQQPIVSFPPGVDAKNFYYDPDASFYSHYPRPYFMSVSRVAKEKNLEAFLDLDLPGTKFIIGNGPHKAHLQKQYPDKAVFLPYENVRQILSLGDVFVSPSKYDTFGIVNIEALACGLPIASFPVMGPVDILEQGVSGYASHDLAEAAINCLGLKKEACIERASHFTWENTANNFLKHQIVLT